VIKYSLQYLFVSSCSRIIAPNFRLDEKPLKTYTNLSKYISAVSGGLVKEDKMAKNTEKKQKPPAVPGDIFGAWCDRLIYWLLLAVIFIIPLFFNIYTFDQFEMPKLMVLRLFICAMMALWAIRSFGAGRFEFTPTPLDVPMAGWVLFNILATIFSLSPGLSIRGEYENFSGSLSNVIYVVLYYIAVNFIRTKKQVKAVTISLMISGFVITIYATAQFFGHDFIKWNEGSMIQGRYFATMGNPNFLGALLIMIIPFNISYLISAVKEKRIALMSGLLVMLALLIISLIGTQSRGPFAGFIISILFFFGYLLYGWRRADANKGVPVFSLFKRAVNANKAVSMTILFFIIASGVFLGTFGRMSVFRLWDSAMHPSESFSRSRLHIWQPALKIIAANPLIGTGVDTFKTVFPKYEGTNFAQIDGANVSSRTAHNELLNTAATMGLFALGFYLLMLWAYTRVWARSHAALKEGPMRYTSLAMFTAFLAYFVQNLVSFGVAAINTALYMLFAMQVTLFQEDSPGLRKTVVMYRPDNPGMQALKPFLQAISAAVFILMGVMAYNVFDADLHYNRGKIYTMYMDNFNYQLAVNMAQNKSTPDDARAVFIECVQDGQESTKETDPAKQSALSRMAVDLYQQGMCMIAVNEHLLSVKEAPGEVKFHVYLGLAYEKLAEKYDQLKNRQRSITYLHESAKEYEKGVQLNPGNSYYWGNVGRVYYLLARAENASYVEQAIKNYQTAIDMAPVTGMFYSNLIDVYLSMGLEDKAKPLIATLEGLDKKLAAASYFGLGNLYYTRKIQSEAEAAYRKSVEFDPDFAQSYYNLGVVCSEKHDRQCVEMCMKTFLEKAPNSDKTGSAREILGKFGIH
jgi:O-antigen ligase